MIFLKIAGFSVGVFGFGFVVTGAFHLQVEQTLFSVEKRVRQTVHKEAPCLPHS